MAQSVGGPDLPVRGDTAPRWLRRRWRRIVQIVRFDQTPRSVRLGGVMSVETHIPDGVVVGRLHAGIAGEFDDVHRNSVMSPTSSSSPSPTKKLAASSP